MRLISAFLANAAEERGGLAYVLGGFWDTVFIPPGQIPAFRGTLLVRLAANRQECGRAHVVELRCTGEDGQPVFNLNVNVTPEIPLNHPLSWEIPVTIVAGVAGPLPRLGLYDISVLADNALITQLPFRAVEGTAPAH